MDKNHSSEFSQNRIVGGGIYSWQLDPDAVSRDTVMRCIPAADVVERKRGNWVGYPDSFKYEHVYDRDAIVCPFCEESWNIVDNDTERFNYCPNCGAEMKEES